MAGEPLGIEDAERSAMPAATATVTKSARAVTVLVGTSPWVEFLRAARSQDRNALDRLLDEDPAFGAAVSMEVLAGAGTEAESSAT